MRESPHIPVLLKETVSQLITDPKGVYIDGTLGFGGHSEAILQRLEPTGMLIGLDLNPNAISFANSRLSTISDNYVLHLINFKSFSKILFQNNIRNIQGFLLDLGLSSALIDQPDYGFSYRNNGPLDMQFDRNGNNSAEKYLNQVSEVELIRIIKLYGEEPNAKKIAYEIIQRVKIGKMKTTFDLKDAVCRVVPERFQNKALARVFQAIRIKINNEIEILHRTLKLAVEFLNTGGRIAVISYHSLEDRIVKAFFKSNSIKCICPPKFPLCSCNSNPKLKKISKKVIIPSHIDVKENSRSRSARLRIAERL
tara:strand:- start:4023 stop:4952 length:930 start_codon:yes stop_codon:yes gene_type:complete